MVVLRDNDLIRSEGTFALYIEAYEDAKVIL